MTTSLSISVYASDSSSDSFGSLPSVFRLGIDKLMFSATGEDEEEPECGIKTIYNVERGGWQMVGLRCGSLR